MLINDIDISIFNASQLKVDIQNSNINIEKDWFRNSPIPIEINSKVTFKPINVELYFKGKGREDILKNISDLIVLLKNKAKIKFDKFTNFYFCFLEESEIQKTISKDRYKLVLKFLGYEIGLGQTIDINQVKSKIVYSEGNINTPIILEITPIIDMVDLSIGGLTQDPLIIKNLKENKKIIIDSLEGTVLQEGENKFTDTDFWEFPFLVPGINTLQVDKDTCNITIKYNPRYL